MSWSVGGVALFAALALVLGGWILRTYLRRELPVPGRGALAALRIAAVLVLLLLLFDPRLPGSLGGPPPTWTLVDASLSMAGSAGPSADGPSAFARALSDADADGPVLLFGDAHPVRASGSPGAAPDRLRSDLVPALEAAAESGARRVVVVTDRRLSDGPEAVAAAERLGLGVEVVDVGQGTVGASVTALELPGALAAGEPVPARVTVAATGAGPADSATVEVREGERLVASRVVALPTDGRATRLDLELPAPASPGPVRWEARVRMAGDRWPADDARAAWAEVDPEEGALVLLSTEPDWEARFLLPVLGRVTGLRTRGLVRVGPDRWLVADAGGAAATVGDERARREARGAEILVVQGGAAGPAWLAGAVADAPRVLVLARAPGDAALAGVAAGPVVPGEWYASPDVASSPVAGALAGVDLTGLPPLGGLLPLRPGADRGASVVALHVRRGPGAPAEPALVLREDGGARRAVALAPGWWRWAFRPARGREPYRRVWSGVAGWLLATPAGGGVGLRPVQRIVERGAPVEWSVGAPDGDTVSLAVAGEGGTVLDTTFVAPPDGRVTTPALPPGRYRWSGRVADGAEVTGPLEVEAWTAEMLHPRVEGLAREAPAAAEGGAPPGAGPPARTHPLPYLLLLGLLSAEWIGRRRRGLR